MVRLGEQMQGHVAASPRRHYASSHASAPSPRISIQTQFSPGFGDWLIRYQVGLVATTYQTGHFLFIGVRDDGTPVPSAARFSRAMGIVAGGQRIYVATKDEIWRLENILKPDELGNDMFDRLYTRRNCQVVGDLNVHELGIEANGRILFCNTLYSCLATVDATEAFRPVWTPPFISRLAPEDRCHLNGLAMENGKARYVTCCSTGDALESWRGRRRDAGVVIDVTTDSIVAEGLSMPHSPRIHGGVLYVVESGRGALVRLAPDGRGEDVAFLPGFARGLAFVNHYAVLTISLPRSAAFAGLPIAEAMRRRGAPPWRGLMIVDLRNGDIVEWLRLEGDVSELFDVSFIFNVRCPRYVDVPR